MNGALQDHGGRAKGLTRVGASGVTFKDFLASMFSFGFFYISWRVITNGPDTAAVELIQSWTPLMALILGGYFGQDMLERYSGAQAEAQRERYRQQIIVKGNGHKHI